MEQSSLEIIIRIPKRRLIPKSTLQSLHLIFQASAFPMDYIQKIPQFVFRIISLAST